jgi:hypothetical protein
LNYTASIADYLDGEMAEINFVDGQALAPTAFGASSIYNQWLPIKYAGTYGTNGFYLPFTNTTSTSTLVADSSGNGNNWTPNNISLTAGSTYDSLTDVPTLTSETVANYAVMNPLNIKGSNTTISNGNLTVSKGVASTQEAAFNTIGITSGSFYWEITPASFSWVGLGVNTGLVRAGGAGLVPANLLSWQSDTGIVNNAGTVLNATTFSAGNVIGFALNTASDTLACYKNGTLIYTVTSLSSAMGLSTGITFFTFTQHDAASNSAVVNFNFGQQPFVYTAPSGFLPLNTFNI